MASVARSSALRTRASAQARDCRRTRAVAASAPHHRVNSSWELRSRCCVGSWASVAASRASNHNSRRRMGCLASATAEVPEVVGASARPSSSEYARTLLTLETSGVLSVSGDNSAFPLSTYVEYVEDQDKEAPGKITFRVQPGSALFDKLQTENCCTFLAHSDEMGAQVTLFGSVAIDEQKEWATLVAEKVLFASEFSSEQWIAVEDYQAATADPLKNVALKIVEHMNTINYVEVQRMCRVFTDIGSEEMEAVVTWIDRCGFDVSMRLESGVMRTARIAFPNEAEDERAAHSELTMLSQMAWDSEKP